MKHSFTVRHTLFLLLILSLILTPRPLAGLADLASAKRFDLAANYPSASAAYASAAARLPWQPALYARAAQTAWLAADLNQARHWFEIADTHHALSQADLLAYGDLLLALGLEPLAVQTWQRSGQQFGSSGDTLFRLALSARRAGDLPQATDLLTRALALSPSDPNLHYQLGLLLAASNPAQALPHLARAAGLDPLFEATYQVLRTEINLASLSEDPAYLFTVSGRALASLGQWDLAASAFQNAISASPTYGTAWAWLGESLQQSGQDGRASLDQALALDQHSASIHALFGLYWMRQSQPGQALTSFQKAAALEPQESAWQVALGDAASASQDLQAALQYYLQAVDLAPADPTVWRALALFCLQNDSDIENSGLLAARYLLRLAPEDWLSYDLAGQVALRLGAWPEAQTHLLKAIQLAPSQPTPHLHLALVCLESGQEALAYDKLLDTIALDPSGPSGWQATRLLEQYFP